MHLCSAKETRYPVVWQSCHHGRSDSSRVSVICPGEESKVTKISKYALPFDEINATAVVHVTEKGLVDEDLDDQNGGDDQDADPEQDF
jgi:hypothetical protein